MSVTPRSLGLAWASCPRWLLLSLSLSLALCLSACSRAHVSRDLKPPEDFLERPQVEPTSAQGAGVRAEDPWWRSFSDPQLDRLVEGLFEENLQLAQAAERVTQMRAMATQAGSQRWPTLNLDLGWSRTKQLNPFSRLSSSSGPMMSGPSAGSALPSSFTQDNFRASLAVSYELDLWGRIGSLTEAAELEALASEADLRSIAVTLSASATELYFQLIEAHGRLRTLKAQLQDDEDALQVVLSRFQQGLAPQIEVLQQTQQRDQTRAQLPPSQALISTLKRRLAALQGAQTLKDLTPPEALPSLPPFPELGLPADLLERRPDIQAARARLSAADARVSAAVSARLPALRIGASGGYQSFELEELFDDVIWSVTSGLITPLFQGGRLRAEQRRAESVLRERLLALKERYLTAYHEVEDALTAERSASAQLQRVLAQRSSAEALFESAQRRYMQGVGDLLTTLAARQGLYMSQLAALAAQRALLSARVQLHRALAGSWVSRLTSPSNPTPSPNTP